MVLYIHDTTHFSARVLEHIPHSNNLTKITFSNTEYMQVTDKIQKYYQNIENRYVYFIILVIYNLKKRERDKLNITLQKNVHFDKHR